MQLEYGLMPNVMAALPNRGGALRSVTQSLADATTGVPCSNAEISWSAPNYQTDLSR